MTATLDTSNLMVFLPLTKVDEDKHEVWGRATQEVVDSANEIMDYESSLPNFLKWSEAAEKRSSGKSKGNLRSMHNPVAAGKLIALQPNDSDRAIDIGVKVTDDNEWRKVLDGTYTGFSVGGKYGKRWGDMKNPGCVRYTAVPQEISLVDAPAVPTATYSLVKADGTVEVRKFREIHDGTKMAPIDVGDDDIPVWASEFTAIMTKLISAVETLETFKKLEADEKDKILGELKQRGSSVGVSRRDGEPLTPPKDYPTDWKLYGDPANWSWPCDDKSRCTSALSYYNGGSGKEKYNPTEWNILGRRIARLASSAFGVKYQFDPKTKRVERIEKMATQKMAKNGNVLELLGSVKQQLAQAVDMIGKDPDATQNLLSQALAALDVAADTESAESQATDPKPPVTQSIDSVKADAAPAPATGSSPSSSPSDLETMSTPPTLSTATTPTTTTMTPTTQTTETTKTPTTVSTPTPSTQTAAAATPSTFEAAVAQNSNDIAAIKEQIASLTAALGVKPPEAAQPEAAAKVAAPANAPLADLNAIVQKGVSPAEEKANRAIEILKAGGPHAYANAVKEAGGEQELQKMVDVQVRASMRAGGIVTADRFKTLDLNPRE